MAIDNDVVLTIPDQLIDRIAENVAAKVIAWLRPLLESHAKTPVERAEPDMDRPPPTFLRLRDLIERLGVSSSTIYRWVEEGRFPQSVSLGGRAVAWRRVEVEEWEVDPTSFVNNE